MHVVIEGYVINTDEFQLWKTKALQKHEQALVCINMHSGCDFQPKGLASLPRISFPVTLKNLAVANRNMVNYSHANSFIASLSAPLTVETRGCMLGTLKKELFTHKRECKRLNWHSQMLVTD